MDSEEIDNMLYEVSVNNCQQSFRKLFNSYYPKMFEVAKYYLQINHLAEEVVADVFIKFWKNRRNVADIKSLKSYLYISVKRQSLNKLRNNANSNLFYIDSLEYHQVVEATNPEKALFSEEYLEYISRSIERLPEKCRIVFKMIKEDNMSYKQVAEITGLSIKTIEMHMSHALKRLRIEIQKYTNYHQSSNVK